MWQFRTNYLKKQHEEELIQYQLPFGGGAGVGASISPIAFIIIQSENITNYYVNQNILENKIFVYGGMGNEGLNKDVYLITIKKPNEEKAEQTSQ